MTIFPCPRCGQVPEVETGTMSAAIRHDCRNGRTYKIEFCGPDPKECRDCCIYKWNEQNAKDNPAWWPERYDYLRTLCKTGRRELDA